MSANLNIVKSKEQCVESSDCIKSTLLSRNITVQERRTSVRLEPEMWQALKEIAQREGCNIHDICIYLFDFYFFLNDEHNNTSGIHHASLLSSEFFC